MSKIVQKHWKWDESFNKDEFKLGESIIPKIKKGIVSLNKNSVDEYSGINDIPWIIKTFEEKIVAVYYRETFFDLIRPDLWELKLEQFLNTIDKVLIPVDEKYKGKILYVAFRDSFVTLAGLVDNSHNKNKLL